MHNKTAMTIQSARQAEQSSSWFSEGQEVVQDGWSVAFPFFLIYTKGKKAWLQTLVAWKDETHLSWREAVLIIYPSRGAGRVYKGRHVVMRAPVLNCCSCFKRKRVKWRCCMARSAVLNFRSLGMRSKLSNNLYVSNDNQDKPIITICQTFILFTT